MLLSFIIVEVSHLLERNVSTVLRAKETLLHSSLMS